MNSLINAPEIDRNKDVLHITVRFTNSFDLMIDIPEPNQTSIIALKHAVRLKLDSPLSKHRLRFIYSGKLLRDDEILSEIIRTPIVPQSLIDPQGKGKAIELSPPRVYINCSIGDILTTTELSAEAEAAALSLENPRKRGQKDNEKGRFAPEKSTRTPRGFDRLLSGGFTAAEVNQLRLQFRSVQQNIHTPDTMPSPNTLLRIEDAWIDDNSGAGSNGTSFDFGDDSLSGGAIDDILWGNLMGFLWPLGCVGFFMRESGVWSGRRKIAIFTGFILNIAFGILKVMS